jgi:hypothetical protein
MRRGPDKVRRSLRGCGVAGKSRAHQVGCGVADKGRAHQLGCGVTQIRCSVL